MKMMLIICFRDDPNLGGGVVGVGPHLALAAPAADVPAAGRSLQIHPREPEHGQVRAGANY